MHIEKRKHIAKTRHIRMVTSELRVDHVYYGKRGQVKLKEVFYQAEIYKTDTNYFEIIL